ncbi:hypothetical protein SAMN05192585_10823 [Acetanaerobacterium elongatum]|uniref:Uncharacterized protein n=1 Tax=Acetanaerobacterium elongatum TaxID=258515 RepID=A0A1G9XBG2_9FIRM|nr:hypothetical protein SAMN05192585_10823 [Acetanaerobacterium elongatum]
MEQTQRRFFAKRDLVVILVLLLVAGGIACFKLFAVPSGGGIAQVYVGNTLTREIDLSRVTQTEIVEIDARLRVKLEVSPGAIRFIESECPDKLCVKTGTLKNPGEYAACLPAGVAVKIVSKTGAGVDAVAG